MWSAAVRMSYILLVVRKTFTHLYGLLGRIELDGFCWVKSNVRFKTTGPGHLTVHLGRSFYSKSGVNKHNAILCKSRNVKNLTLKALMTIHMTNFYSLFVSFLVFLLVGSHLREADVTHLYTNQRRATFESEIGDSWPTWTTPKHS